MEFKKGEDTRRNTAGRPKGSENRSNKAIRDALRAFITLNMDQLQKDFNALESWQRLTLFERLIKHVLPAPLQPIERLTEDEFNELVKRVKDGNYE